jgi:crossover junction endodeoxyribonuclease RuvC
MIILGIDPGFARTGWAVVAEENKKLRLLSYGCIDTKPSTPFPERLKKIHEELGKIISTFSPEAVAVEKIFFCKNVKTAVDVGQARGVVILAAAENNLKIYEFTPLEVKQTITGFGKADKSQIQKMTKILLNLKETPKPDDAADAIALTITGIGVHRLSKI